MVNDTLSHFYKEVFSGMEPGNPFNNNNQKLTSL